MEPFQYLFLFGFFALGVFFLVKPDKGAKILISRMKLNLLYGKSAKHHLKEDPNKMHKMMKIGSMILGIAFIAMSIFAYFAVK